MNEPRRPVLAHLPRIAACLLMLAAGAAAQSGMDGIRLLPGHFGIRVSSLAENAAVFAVLLLAAVVPLFAKSRRWRTVQLVLDVAVLGLWTGSFLSTARLLGWAGAGLPGGVVEWTIALAMLSTALLYPVFGRPSHYCLWVCPYGAAQELASRLPVRKWRLSPVLVRWLTVFRRALWAGLMLALWCAAWSGWTEWELFGAFAWRAVPPLVTAFALAFVALSAFVPRAYCRFVCPTGTLLKLAESNQPGTPEP
jgi:hypothetical protein